MDPRVELMNFADEFKGDWKSAQSKNVWVGVGAQLVEKGLPLDDVKEVLSKLYEALAFEFGESDHQPDEPIDEVPYNELGGGD